MRVLYVRRCGPQLRALSLAWCYRVSDWGLDALVERCARLRALDLTGLHQIVGARALPRVAHAMPALEWLKLENCNRVRLVRLRRRTARTLYSTAGAVQELYCTVL